MIKDLISIIIPTYNAEDFIAKTINSILRQTYNYFEVLVLDDGSSDNTASLVKDIAKKDNRIKYFYQSNQGLAYSRNRLSQMASGEYIAFLDHDDEWLPEKLKIQIDLFKRRSNCALIYGNVLNVFSDGRNSSTYFANRKPHRGKVFYEYLIEGNFVPQPSIILKTEILREYLPFNADFKIAVDWELLLRLARDHSFDYVEEVVAIYNFHDNRATAKNPFLEIEEILSIMDYWYKNDPKLQQAYKKQFLRSKAKVNLQKAYLYQSNKNYLKELGELVSCLRIDPIWLRLYLKLLKDLPAMIVNSFHD